LSVETPVNLALLVGHSPRGLPPWLSKLSVRSSSSSSPMVGYPWTASRGSRAGRGTAKPATPARHHHAARVRHGRDLTGRRQSAAAAPRRVFLDLGTGTTAAVGGQVTDCMWATRSFSPP